MQETIGDNWSKLRVNAATPSMFAEIMRKAGVGKLASSHIQRQIAFQGLDFWAWVSHP
jgi:hypothetical protein